MKIYFLPFMILFILKASKGLRCWTCINAKNNQQCIDEGKLIQCQINENACHNEVRRGDKGLLITKRCKQDWACTNNEKQNEKSAWIPKQCNYRVPSSVCRCCCDSDGCNKYGNNCNKEKPLRCAQIGVPSFGRKLCKYELEEEEVGSVCSFVCNRGWNLVGSRTSKCTAEKSNKFARFNEPVPKCVRRVATLSKCSKQLAPVHGSMECTKGEEMGSVCQYACIRPYTLIGANAIECSNRGRWNDVPPICEDLRCEDLQSPQFGKKSCSSENEEGSVCTFSCNAGYRMKGSKSAVCQRVGSVGVWSSNVPSCARILCPNQGEIKNGTVTCANGDYFGSVCSFTCNNKDLELLPIGATENVCQENSKWSIPKPCCSRVCSALAVVDFVILVDSSSSVGANNWETIKGFTRQLIATFQIGRDAARIGVFRYNKEVDIETQIMLGDFPDNKTAILQQFDAIPYDGKGTNTGNALRHAREVLFAQRNGNRPSVSDYLLVITDGQSKDDVSAISKLLHNDGVEVLAIGVVPSRGTLDYSQLNDIVSDRNNLVVAESGFESLEIDLFYNLVRGLCVQGCV